MPVESQHAGRETEVAAFPGGDHRAQEADPTGIGISEEEQAKIFDPAYRAKQPGPHQVAGLGLGLAISRDLARAMGGDITVSSVPDNGSRFTLTLPLAAEPVPASA